MTHCDDSCFWIDDGSARAAEAGLYGIKGISDAAVTEGQMVRAVGVSSTYKANDNVWSVI